MIPTVQSKSKAKTKNNGSLVPSGFTNLFSKTQTHTQHKHQTQGVENRSPKQQSNISLSTTIGINNDEQNVGSPGPGEYDVSSSPFNSRLPPSVSSPSLKARTSPYEMFPSNDNPSPGAYDTPKETISSTKFGNAARKTFLDDVITARSGSPGPGEFMSDYNQQRNTLGSSHSSWGKNDSRDIFTVSETPAPDAYAPNNSTISAGLSSSHSRGNKSDGAGIKDDRMFGDIVRKAQQLPGVGDYDVTTSSYNHRLPPAIKSPKPMSGSSGNYNLFPIDTNPGPGSYQLYDDSGSSLHTPKFNKGIRTTYVDDALRETIDVPGPGKYSPNTVHTPGGKWREKTTAFDIWGKPPLSPSPDAYQPSTSLVSPTPRTADFSNSIRGNCIDDSIKDSDFKIAPGTYSESIPPLVKRQPPKIQRRFMTKEIIPSKRGSNEDVVLRIASNEVTGGFRKVSEKEVYEDYKNRMHHTKDCVKAYTLPSTITIIAALSENVYANPAGEGRWRTIPTGGAVRLKKNQPIENKELLKGGEKKKTPPPPLSKQKARKQYEQVCHLGNRNKEVQQFVKHAISPPKPKSNISKYEQVEEVVKIKKMEQPPADELAKASLRLIMERRTKEKAYNDRARYTLF